MPMAQPIQFQSNSGPENIFVGGVIRNDYRGQAWNVADFQNEVLGLLAEIGNTRSGDALLNNLLQEVLIIPVQDSIGAANAGHMMGYTNSCIDIDLVDAAIGTEFVVLNAMGTQGTLDARYDKAAQRPRSGSDVIIQFTPDFYDASSPLFQTFGGDFRPDCILFHELVHAARMTRGEDDGSRLEAIPLPRGDLSRYHDVEEFLAIMLTNIYRSERHNMTQLRASHATTYDHYASPQTFLNVPEFVALLDGYFAQSRSILRDFSRVPAPWNPLAEYFQQKITSLLPP